MKFARQQAARPWLGSALSHRPIDCQIMVEGDANILHAAVAVTMRWLALIPRSSNENPSGVLRLRTANTDNLMDSGVGDADASAEGPAGQADRGGGAGAAQCADQAPAAGAKALRTDAKCAAEQCEIQTQMINVITNATDFVYIENQFFQSEFGTPSVDSFGPDAERTMSSALRYVMSKKMNLIEAGVSTANHLPSERLLPANKICEALGRRIESAVRRGEPFHVYMVLPVHPEGRLDDPLVIGQVHWTMQSLVFADHSLINRIRRAIKAKEICTNTLNNGRWDEAMKAAGSTPLDTKNPVFSSVVPDQWGKYLTLLNVRNCQIIDGRARTEQIYVHSKLLIADDRHIILGSANINDRSQSGSRD